MLNNSILCCLLLLFFNLQLVAQRSCESELAQAIRAIQRLEMSIDLKNAEIERLKDQLEKYNTPSNTIENYQYNQRIYSEEIDNNSIKTYQLKIAGDLRTQPSTLATRIDLFENQFDTYIIDLNFHELSFLWKDQYDRNYSALGVVEDAYAASGRSLFFATNGGMYDPAQSPKGLFIANGHTEVYLNRNRNGAGNFFLQPNGIFLIDTKGVAHIVTTSQYLNYSLERTVEQATQSGPMLISDGILNEAFTPNSKNKCIRSGVGVMPNNRVVFIISSEPVNFYDFATLFKKIFDCQNALFLDGVISQMFCPELGRYDRGGEFGAIISLVR